MNGWRIAARALPSAANPLPFEAAIDVRGDVVILLQLAEVTASQPCCIPRN
jgi:hypothetical protein